MGPVFVTHFRLNLGIDIMTLEESDEVQKSDKEIWQSTVEDKDGRMGNKVDSKLSKKDGIGFRVEPVKDVQDDPLPGPRRLEH